MKSHLLLRSLNRYLYSWYQWSQKNKIHFSYTSHPPFLFVVGICFVRQNRPIWLSVLWEGLGGIVPECQTSSWGPWVSDVVEIDSVPLEEHSVVVLRTWWQWFLRKKTLNLAQFLGNKKRSLMLFLAWHSTRMEWTLACLGEGGFWRCHLTCRFFLMWWRQVPSAPDSLCCLGCGSQFLLSQSLTLCWCSPYFCFRPVCFTAKHLSITPKLISSS